MYASTSEDKMAKQKLSSTLHGWLGVATDSPDADRDRGCHDLVKSEAGQL